MKRIVFYILTLLICQQTTVNGQQQTRKTENVSVCINKGRTSQSLYHLIPNDATEIFVSSPLLTQKDISTSVINLRQHKILLVNVSTSAHDIKNKTDKLKIEISYTSKEKSYSEDKYRSKEWDDILRSIISNPEEIHDFDYDRQTRNIIDNNLEGCHYLIVCPDNQGMRQWADTLAKFRNEQGILTKVMNINEIEENLPIPIKNHFMDIYYDWELAPSAILLFGDYSKDNSKGISSYYLNNHPETGISYLADNRLVDFDNDNLPEICISRLPVANAQQAELMVKKTIRYEKEPSSNPDYYDKPVTAMGFEESRWFQLCSEVIAGYFEKKGKTPNRLNAINSGTPDSVWSTGENTDDVIKYFGSQGLNYIPDNLQHISDWESDENDLSAAINKGTFIVQHRDHGTFQNWSNPYFSNNEIDNLTNEDLSFIMSANCQTGDFSYGEENDDCFAERFLRTNNGAVAIIAASQISYSFVNDTYVWGFYDYLWNDFMPDYGDNNIQFKYPAFANVYGKYFLKQSSWPYISAHKDVTYNLFHYFGDAFLKMNTEMPEEIEISYPKEISSECSSFSIKKDKDIRVAISHNGKILATLYDNDSTVNIEPFLYETRIKVVATKQDHFRHEGYIDVKSHLNEDDLRIYPNPAKEIIYIESKGIKNVFVYNTLGQKIMEIDNRYSKERIEINCEHLTKGLFHLHIIYEDKRVGKSFIVR